MNQLTLKFKATPCNGWPKLKFLIDFDLIEEYHFNSFDGEISIPIDLLDGAYLLNIELFDKTEKNTIVDTTGKITEDQKVELVDIYIDNVKLPNFYKWMGVYRFNDQEYPQSLCWGCNGIWTWPFQTPILTWVLDEKIKHREKYDQPEISYFKKIKTEEINLSRLEKQLVCIKE